MSNAAELYQRYYPESQFGGFSDVDGTIAFYHRVSALITANATVLDVGCGRGAHTEDPIPTRRALRNFRGRCQRVIGLDVDDVAGQQNPSIDEFRALSSDRWPCDDSSADLVICDCVVEHLAAPELFFREGFRVLRPGGTICIRTTNLLSYVGILSRLIPNRLHQRVLRTAQPHRKGVDVFPVYYRCNTVWGLRRLLTSTGFNAIAYGYEAEPSYLGLNPLAYLFGVLHQKLAPGTVRLCIFGFGRKPHLADPASGAGA